MKSIRILAACLAVIMVLCACTACHSNQVNGGTSTKVTEKKYMNPGDVPVNTDMTLLIGETYKWTPFEEADTGVVFSTSDYRFVEVHTNKNYAVVEAIAEGEANVTAEWNNNFYKIHVIVKKTGDNEVRVSVVQEETESCDQIVDVSVVAPQ